MASRAHFFASLRSRLLLLVLLAVLPALGVIVFRGVQQRRAAIRNSRAEVAVLARLAAAGQEQLIEAAHQVCISLSRLPEVRRYDAAACSSFFAELVDLYPSYGNIRAVKPDGTMFASAVALPGPVNVSDRPWFQATLQSRAFCVGHYIVSRVDGRPTLPFGYPAMDKTGKLLVVVSPALELGALSQMVSRVELSRDAILTVVDQAGTVIARSRESEKWVGKTLPEEPLVNAVLRHPAGTIETVGLDGIRRLYAYSRVGARPGTWSVAVGIPLHAVVGDANHNMVVGLILLGIVALLALVAAWWLGGALIVEPVRRLEAAVERLETGDLQARAAVTGGSGELTHLGRAFNSMAAALQARSDERDRAEAAQRLNTDRVQALLKLNQMTDATLRQVTDFALEEAVRLTQSEIGYLAFLNADETVLTMHAWSRQAMRECAITTKPIDYMVKETGLWGEAVRQRRAVVTNDYAAPSPLKKGYPAGHVAVHRHMNVPVSVGTHIVLVAGVGNKHTDYDDNDVQQLTLLMEGMWRLVERMRAEDRIRQLNAELEDRVVRRTAELAAANKEMEAFSYSVSHDLRAPLRAIDGFSQIVLEDCGERLDPEGREHLKRIRAATQRMGHLIDDLLNLSRLSRTEMKREQVDLTDLANQIVAELRAAEPGRQVEVVVGGQLHADGDRSLIRVALANLLGNAWKFTGKTETARIEFGSLTDDEQRATFFVKDNGAGFDMAYASRLFGAFQRLHGATDFPGTGIGLATVARIIRRHGGTVRAEGAVGQGATFFFTLEPETTETPGAEVC